MMIEKLTEIILITYAAKYSDKTTIFAKQKSTSFPSRNSPFNIKRRNKISTFIS